MTLAITLQSVVNGQTQTIIRAEGGVLSLGREPENSVVVDSDAVSRQHACIGSCGNQWVFWDLGSSNGSWVNGEVVTEDQKVLLRLGDVVQLANFAFRIADASGNVPARGVKAFGTDASLLIFDRGDFVKEVALQAAGSQFVLGGAESDIPYGESEDSLSQLSIVQTGQEVELFVGQEGDAVYVNDEAVNGSLRLSDRDRINISQYCIVVNRPTDALEASNSPARFATAGSAPSELHEIAAYDRYHLPKHLSGKDDDWQSETGRRHVNRGKKFIFTGDAAAQPMREELQMTQAPDDARFGRGLSALHQASLGAFPSERTLVQRIAIAAGGILLLLLFAWALSNMLASS